MENQEARELALYTINNSECYRLSEAIRKNYARKIKKGIFDNDKAIIGMKYLTELAAKKYCKEFCDKSTKYHEVFNAESRRIAAKEILEYYMEEIKEIATKL